MSGISRLGYLGFEEDAVREQLAAFRAAGATVLRVGALCSTPEEPQRTRALLLALCKEADVA